MKIHQTYWDTRTKVFTKKEPMGVEMRQSAARLHRMKRKNLSIVDNIFTHKNIQTKWINCAEGSLRAILITIDIDFWCMLQFITHLPIKMLWNNNMSRNWKHFFFQTSILPSGYWYLVIYKYDYDFSVHVHLPSSENMLLSEIYKPNPIEWE